MTHLLKHPVSVVWLILAGATAVSWWFGAQTGIAAETASPSTTLLLIVIAGIKCQLILSYFMEIRGAPWPLRLMALVWVLGVVVSILGLYWLMPTA